MSLAKWNPFNELQRIQKEFDSFLNTDSYLAPLDLIENEDEYELKIDLPGFSQEEITIEADNEKLTISAQHSEENEDKSDNSEYVLKERVTRKFSRNVRFTKPINPKEANLTLEKGVLTITIPKSEDAKSIKLKIN